MSNISTDHYRWLVVIYTLVIQGVSVGILIYCFALFSLPWLDEFSASRRDVMITISVLQIVMGFFSPWIGRYLDKVSMRWIVLAGTILLATGLFLLQFASALWHVWLIYATILPVASLMMGSLAAQTLVAKWFVTDRGLALGISAMGTSLGGIVFPWLVAEWLVALGWRETMQTLAMTHPLFGGPNVALTWVGSSRVTEPTATHPDDLSLARTGHEHIRERHRAEQPLAPAADRHVPNCERQQRRHQRPPRSVRLSQWIRMFTETASAIRMKPRPNAKAKSPLAVSSAMAVVSTRVT